MPLLIEGAPLPSAPVSIEEWLEDFPHLKESALVLRQQPVRKVDAPGLLYVDQREYAATYPADKLIHTIGTDDATTCHIVILRHTGSGACSLGHFDGTGMKDGVRGMVESVKLLSHGGPDGRFELTLAGGFIDKKKESIKITKSLLGEFIIQNEEVHLVTACTTDLNDEMRNNCHFPVIYGLAVHVNTGEIFRATFSDKNPDIAIRSACNFMANRKMVNIYKPEEGIISIGPYEWEPWSDVDRWVTYPDPIIRMYLSTSPEQEPPYFEAQIREALKVIQQNPDPTKTLFPNRMPRLYQKQPDGTWVHLKS